MSFGATIRARVHALCSAFRSDPADPTRVWVRRHRRAVATGAALVVGAVSFDAWLLTCGFHGCPTAVEIRGYVPPEGGRVLDRRGELIGRLALIRRVNVPLEQVPAHVRTAFIATEDRRFHAHHGVDWRSFARAVMRNVSSLRVREGFSTITMQVARNTFMAERDALERSIGRKLLELRLTRLLESTLTKDEILERYLNVIYLGNGVYGVEGASRDLFGKGVARVSVAEGAMLAALPKGPSSYTPRRHPERARARRDLVLSLMEREGYLRADRAAAARASRLRLAATSWAPATPHESYALDAVRTIVDSLLRATRAGTSEVTVHTALDLRALRAAERAVRVHADRIGRESGVGRAERETLQGAMVALDPRTGEVRALVGGRRHERGGFNRALAARRQAGSAFKPFVYAAALGAGFTPASVVDDTPISIETGRDVWTPANYGGEYRGPVTLRRALAQSANAAAVRVSRSVGESRVADVARRSGIDSRFAAVPAIALGAVDVTPLELVTAYATFANGGRRVAPILVRRIEHPDGTPLWTSRPSLTPVMDPRDAFQITSMLRSVVDEGTARGVRAAGIPGQIAGKTGTTNNGSDVWFVGYTPTLVAGFWFGFDTPRSLGNLASGGRHAVPAWVDFYRAGWPGKEGPTEWTAPDGLVARDVDPETGLLAEEWCESRQKEWFRPGSEPTAYSCQHDDEWDDEDEWIGNLEEEVRERIADAFRRIVRGRM